VILQEIGQANDTPDDIVFDYFQERAYPDQAMGRPVLGSPKIIKKLSRKSVVSYLKDHYGAARMVLSAAGKLDHDEIARSPTSFSPACRPTRREHRPARYVGGEHRQDAISNSFIWCWDSRPAARRPGLLRRRRAVDRIRRRHVLAALPEVREKRGLVYSINSFAHSYRDGGCSASMPVPARKRRPNCCPVLCAETKKLDDGFKPVELARAKAQMRAGCLMSLEAPPRAASRWRSTC